MKNLKPELINSKELLSRDEMRTLLGGVSREEYCSTLKTIEQGCFNRGDLTCLKNAGDAWETNCA